LLVFAGLNHNKEQGSVFSAGFWDDEKSPGAQTEFEAAVIRPLRGTLAPVRHWTWALQC